MFFSWPGFHKNHSEQVKRHFSKDFGGYCCASLYRPADTQTARRHRRKSPNILRIQPAHQFFSQQKEIITRLNGQGPIPKKEGLPPVHQFRRENEIRPSTRYDGQLPNDQRQIQPAYHKEFLRSQFGGYFVPEDQEQMSKKNEIQAAHQFFRHQKKILNRFDGHIVLNDHGQVPKMEVIPPAHQEEIITLHAYVDHFVPDDQEFQILKKEGIQQTQQKEYITVFVDQLVPDDQRQIPQNEDVVTLEIGTQIQDTGPALWGDLTLDTNNLDWLLQFRIQDFVKRLDDGEENVCHDHNYESNKTFSRTIFGTATSPDPIYRSKPSYTYTELIELALRNKGTLTVSGIYNWIMETFPYYRMSDERWKNAVRHNLSINPQFMKGEKQDGGCHLWKIATDQVSRKAETIHWKKRKLDELERMYPQMFDKPTMTHGSCLEANEAVRMLAISEELPSYHHQQMSLSTSAERILYGEPEHRVQVEYLPTMDRSSSALDVATEAKRRAFARHHSWQCGLSEDVAFLNPISSLDVMEECGLLTDPTSSQTVLSIPRMQCANELETGSDLFDYDLLRILSSSPL